MGDAIMGFVTHFLTWLMGLLPSWSSLGLPDMSGYGAAIADSRIWQWIGWANHYVPLDVALVVIGARLAVWAALYVVEFFSWALTKLHIFGGAR